MIDRDNNNDKVNYDKLDEEIEIPDSRLYCYLDKSYYNLTFNLGLNPLVTELLINGYEINRDNKIIWDSEIKEFIIYIDDQNYEEGMNVVF